MSSPKIKITYSVIARNPNSWDASTGVHEEIANCGHHHRTFGAAYACMERLSYASDGSLVATWYHATVENSLGQSDSACGQPYEDAMQAVFGVTAGARFPLS